MPDPRQWKRYLDPSLPDEVLQEANRRIADLETRLSSLDEMREVFAHPGWSALQRMLEGMVREAKDALPGVRTMEQHQYVVGQIRAFSWLSSVANYVETEIGAMREELAQLSEMFPDEGSSP